MREYILNTLDIDNERLDLLVSKSRQIELVKTRWNVWESLQREGYPLKEIGKFFNRPTGVIKHGIARFIEEKGKIVLPKLTSRVVYNASGVKCSNIFKKTRDAKITRERWKVYETLRKIGYSTNSIAEYFGNSAFAVNYGLREIQGPKIDKSLPKITASVVSRIGNDDEPGIYEGLRHFGHSREQIARYFKVSLNHVNYMLRTARQNRKLKELNKRRKSFVKF